MWQLAKEICEQQDAELVEVEEPAPFDDDNILGMIFRFEGERPRVYIRVAAFDEDTHPRNLWALCELDASLDLLWFSNEDKRVLIVAPEERPKGQCAWIYLWRARFDPQDGFHLTCCSGCPAVVEA